MKTQYFTRVSIARGAAALLILPFQMLPVAEGSTQPQDIEVADIARLCVRVNKIGATGIGKAIGTEGETRYEIDGSELKVYLAPVDRLGEMTVVVDGTYGEIKLHEVVFVDVKNDAESEVEISPYIFSAIAAGGGGGVDYKTDIYMDGAGRVILERLSDGSTLLLDEHENPILKRNADGSTKFFDAYQSERMTISEHGDINFNGNVSGAGMEQYILGLQGGKFVHGTEQLNFAQVKAAVEDVHKFVYLDFANAFHLPSFIVDAEGNSAVAFSSAFTIDGKPHIERVVINEQEDIKVDNYTMLAPNEDGGVEFGDDCEANTNAAFAHGLACHAEDEGSHAEGDSTTASGNASHSEGTNTTASGNASHAEGNQTKAEGESSHAEGKDTTASADYSHAEGGTTEAGADFAHAEGKDTHALGDYSHAEGEYTIANNNGSHAEGYENTASGEYSHAEGDNTNASGKYSHAEGAINTASGNASHSEGTNTTASGNASHAEGEYTIASAYASHAQGKYNNQDDANVTGAFSHGCGTSSTDRRNSVLFVGDKVYILGVGGYDGTNHTQAQDLASVIAGL